jgi:hypothetical protein
VHDLWSYKIQLYLLPAWEVSSRYSSRTESYTESYKKPDLKTNALTAEDGGALAITLHSYSTVHTMHMS